MIVMGIDKKIETFIIEHVDVTFIEASLLKKFPDIE